MFYYAFYCDIRINEEYFTSHFVVHPMDFGE